MDSGESGSVGSASTTAGCNLRVGVWMTGADGVVVGDSVGVVVMMIVRMHIIIIIR